MQSVNIFGSFQRAHWNHNEEPQKTAARELIEETGYQTDDLKFLTKFYTSPGISTELMHAYVARNLTFLGQNLEETEEIETFKFEWNIILNMIQNGQIKDGKTISTLLFYRNFF